MYVSLLLPSIAVYNILILGVLSQTYKAHPPRRVGKDNAWEIQNFYMQRRNWTTTPNIAGNLYLYRSYYNNCTNPDIYSLEMALTEEPCDAWVIPDTPIICRIKTPFPADQWSSEWTPSANSSWASCDTNLRVAEGTENITEEQRQWIKWRIIDLQERDDILPDDQFITANLEILNGIPIYSAGSNSSPSQVRVFSTVYILSKADLVCNPPPKGIPSIKYTCNFHHSTAKLKCKAPASCYTYVTVTEKVELIEDWNKRFP